MIPAITSKLTPKQSLRQHHSTRFLLDFDFRPKTQIAFFSAEMAEAGAGADDSNVELVAAIETVFKSMECINGSFLRENDRHLCCSKRNAGVDVAEAERAFDFVRKMENDKLKKIVSVDGARLISVLLTKMSFHRFGTGSRRMC